VSAQLTVISVSISVAGCVQLAGVLWLLKRMGMGLRWRLRPLEAGIRPALKLMMPMLFGLGLLQLSELLQSVLAWWLRATEASGPTFSILGWEFARPLAAGVMQRIDAARYLYQFPLGVLATSLGVAVFPLLSRYAARNDMLSFRQNLNRALRLAMMEGLASGVGMLVLAEPITRLIFRHGRFTEADVLTSAFVTQMYVAGMWAYCTYQILVRAFYSLKDTRTPVTIGAIMSGVQLLLLLAVLVWLPGLGAGAFGLTTAIVFTVNALWLGWMLRRRLGRFGGRKLAVSVVRSLLAAAAMAAVLLLLQWQLIRAGVANWIVVAVCVPAGAAVFFLAAWALRAPELGELLESIRKPEPAETIDRDAGNDT